VKKASKLQIQRNFVWESLEIVERTGIRGGTTRTMSVEGWGMIAECAIRPALSSLRSISSSSGPVCISIRVGERRRFSSRVEGIVKARACVGEEGADEITIRSNRGVDGMIGAGGGGKGDL
jgi:hypothetical protein